MIIAPFQREIIFLILKTIQALWYDVVNSFRFSYSPCVVTEGARSRSDSPFYLPPYLSPLVRPRHSVQKRVAMHRRPTEPPSSRADVPSARVTSSGFSKLMRALARPCRIIIRRIRVEMSFPQHKVKFKNSWPWLGYLVAKTWPWNITWTASVYHLVASINYVGTTFYKKKKRIITCMSP